MSSISDCSSLLPFGISTLSKRLAFNVRAFLQSTHNQHLIQRDVTPENMLIGQNGMGGISYPISLRCQSVIC